MLMTGLVELLGGFGSVEDAGHDGRHGLLDELNHAQAYCLYISHFLSMWNSRMYEFGVILFIQASFPGNLMASSINGITEHVCVLLFSSMLGRWVDHEPSRLRSLLMTIIANRITVVICCSIWALILASELSTSKRLLFASVLTLGMVEKLSRMANTLSMERDWVPTLASPAKEGASQAPYRLTNLNTIMRRIDVACKLTAPLAISAFISASTPSYGIWAIAVSSGLSWAIECWCVRQVWNKQRRLWASKKRVEIDLEPVGQEAWKTRTSKTRPKRSWINPRLRVPYLQKLVPSIRASLQAHGNELRYYFNSWVWIPSICVAILHESVLSYSGTLVTYLLNAGFTLSFVTVVRTVGLVFEVGSTFIFPWAVHVLSGTGPAPRTFGINSRDELSVSSAQDVLLEDVDDGRTMLEAENPGSSQLLEPGVVKVGLWGMYTLFLSLIPVMLALFYLDPTFSHASSAGSPSLLAAHPIPILVLFTFLSFSLLGRWTYDLATTQLTQALIPATHRSSFGGTEMSIVSGLSLVHWVSAAVWHQQTDFKWLALASFVAVGAASAVYQWWFRWWVGTGMRKMYAVEIT